MRSIWEHLPCAIGAAALVALSACTPPAREPKVCKSLSFGIKKSEWIDVRRLMHDFAIESLGNPPFLDKSYEDPVGRRYVNLLIERSHVAIRVTGFVFRDGETVTLSVVDAGAAPDTLQCSSWIRADYDNARAKLETRWAISESPDYHEPVVR